jgi:hypothetical protein
VVNRKRHRGAWGFYRVQSYTIRDHSGKVKLSVHHESYADGIDKVEDEAIERALAMLPEKIGDGVKLRAV